MYKLKMTGRPDASYYIGGTGDPLVIVHGGGGGSETWLENARKLSGHYTVIVPDLPGYGDTKSTSDTFHLIEYVRFLSDFTARLGLKRFALLGHSIGGNIAVEFALRYPERVCRLVLADSLGLSNRVGRWVHVLASTFLIKILGKVTLGLLRGAKWLLRTLFASAELVDPLPPVKMDMGRYIAGLKNLPDMTRRLAYLKVPTLLVWGEGDTIVPVGIAHEAVKVIPDCKLCVIEGRHGAYSESSDDFCSAVVTFLSPENIFRPAPASATTRRRLKRIFEPAFLVLSLLLFLGLNRLP